MSQIEGVEGEFSPLDTRYHVRLLEAPERTEGGIYLPETLQENWWEAEVLSAGPGGFTPAVCGGARTLMWAQVGDTVLFEKHGYRPFTVGGKEGIVRDESLLALTGETGLVYLFNDWVAVTLERCPEVDTWGLEIPEDYRRRPRSGRVQQWGPGRMILKAGPFYGTRLPVRSIMGLDEAYPLDGCIVHWSPDARVVEVGRDRVEVLLVKAGDILCLETPNGGEEDSNGEGRQQEVDGRAEGVGPRRRKDRNQGAEARCAER